MRIRLCDKCKKEIPKGDEFIRCLKMLYGENKRYINRQVPVGDLCLKCWGGKHDKQS